MGRSAGTAEMSQSVNPTIHLVKAMDKPADQQWIVALVEHEHGVRYEVGNLQKPGFLDACEIWDIREISQDSPARAELPKLVNPNLCALIESALPNTTKPRSSRFLRNLSKRDSICSVACNTAFSP